MNNFTEQFKKQARKLGFKMGKLTDLCLPKIGTTFSLDGLIYRITYVRNNPLAISAEVTELSKSDLKGEIKNSE